MRTWLETAWSHCLRFAKFGATAAALSLLSSASARAQETGGGEAGLKLPDLSQVKFLGVNGHTLLAGGAQIEPKDTWGAASLCGFQRVRKLTSPHSTPALAIPLNPHDFFFLDLYITLWYRLADFRHHPHAPAFIPSPKGLRHTSHPFSRISPSFLPL